MTETHKDTPDLEVEGLLREMEELKLPFYFEKPIRGNLNLILEINGTTDPNEKMQKRLLFAITGNAIMFHRAMKEANQAHVESCPVGKLFHDSDGKFHVPFVKKKDVKGGVVSVSRTMTHTAGENGKPDSDAMKEESSITLSLMEGIKAKGPIAWAVAAVAALFLYGYIQQKSFAKKVDERVDTLIALQAKFADRAMADRETKAEQAVARTEDVKATIGQE